MQFVILRRREFITLLGSAAVAWPIGARAQQPAERMRRIGVLMPVDEPQGQVRAVAFAEGLEKLGWINGRNISIDYLWAVDTDRLRAYATELVGMTPDVLLAGGGAALVALQTATQTIPIVFASVADPVANGFVASVARPSPALQHTSKPSA
jgi:putative ABC transport system substrate-binding protein